MASFQLRKTPDVSLVAKGDKKATLEIKTFLREFGYLASDGQPGVHDLKTALTSFQKDSGIPQTGEYDKATANEMQKPRCAVRPQGRLATARASGSIISTWPNPNLTYSIDNITPKMKEQDVLSCLANVFRQWGACSGLKFTQVKGGGNIRFAWKGSEQGGVEDFDGAGGNLARAWYPTDGRVHFDNAESWDVTMLTSAALHEVGHALGLDHSPTKDTVMYATYSGRQDLEVEDKLRMGEAYGPYAPLLTSSKGLGGYDLTSSADEAFAYDWNQTGRADHICFYRPGKGIFWIVGADHMGTWRSVYTSTNGLGGFDLMDPRDKAFAFDNYGAGKNTAICLYRPGTGAIFLVARDSQGNFKTVYKQEPAIGNGIGGFDLKNSADRAFALDFKSRGSLDHICLYRPGHGSFFIVGHNGTEPWIPVYGTVEGGNGVGDFDLTDSADRAFAFDYKGDGKMNHICLYRPGKGAFFVIQRDISRLWHPIYASRPGGEGVGGFDLTSSQDRITTLDGKTLFLYRPGRRAAFVVTNKDSRFEAFYKQGQDGSGIGGYDLNSGNDRAFSLSMNINNKVVPDQLVLYRPGTGTIQILKKL